MKYPEFRYFREISPYSGETYVTRFQYNEECGEYILHSCHTSYDGWTVMLEDWMPITDRSTIKNFVGSGEEEIFGDDIILELI